MAVVLVIEDNNLVYKLCTKILGSEHKIFEAKNTTDGLRLLKEHNLDLVIIDTLVPDSKGLFLSQHATFKLLSFLKTTNSKMKVIVYSVLCYEPEFRNRAIDLGVDVCLPKGESIEVLQKAIISLLDIA